MSTKWAQDFMDCTTGEHGLEWQQRADEWIQEHADDRGSVWESWRELRMADSETSR